MERTLARKRQSVSFTIKASIEYAALPTPASERGRMFARSFLSIARPCRGSGHKTFGAPPLKV
jgi:hypothetical protein